MSVTGSSMTDAQATISHSGVLSIDSGTGLMAISAAWVGIEPADPAPIAMILTCPSCGGRHVDQGQFATKVHHTHACQHCGMVWRPAIVATVGVQFLPGFKDGDQKEAS